MFPNHHVPYDKLERTLRPYRRPLPRESEIRLRIKRAKSRGEV